MKAAVFRGIGQIEVTEVPTPQPGPEDVLVHVHYCGICGSDLEAYQTGMYQPGLIVGHEFSGEIVAVGEAVHGWAVGERVIADNVLPCGQCWFCRQGRPTLCQAMITPGVTLDGAMAEYVRLPAALLHRVPAGLSMRAAALIEPLSIAVQGVRSSAMRLGDRVLVLGAGPIGLLVLQCALLAGARQVFCVETNPRRTALALELGAAAVFHPQRDNLAVELAARTEGLCPDLVFVCTGAAAAYSEALNLVRKGGQVYVLGLCAEPVSIDFLSIVLGELSVRGGYMGHGAFPAALDYAAQGRVRLEPLISDEIELQDVVASGFEELLRPDVAAVKVLVRVAGGG